MTTEEDNPLATIAVRRGVRWGLIPVEEPVDKPIAHDPPAGRVDCALGCHRRNRLCVEWERPGAVSPACRTPRVNIAGFVVSNPRCRRTRKRLRNNDDGPFPSRYSVPEWRCRSRRFRLQRLRVLRVRTARREDATNGAGTVACGTVGPPGPTRAWRSALFQHGERRSLACCHRHWRRRIRARPKRRRRGQGRAPQFLVLGGTICRSETGDLNGSALKAQAARFAPLRVNRRVLVSVN
jgi:hypothetical protein